MKITPLKLSLVNLVKLASQRLRMMDKKRDESTNQLEKLISVVRKQLSFSVAKILANNFKLQSSYLSSAVALVASPINGCFRGDFDSDKHVEVKRLKFFGELHIQGKCLVGNLDFLRAPRWTYSDTSAKVCTKTCFWYQWSSVGAKWCRT